MSDPSIDSNEMKRLKGEGFLVNRGTNNFSARVITGNGTLTAVGDTEKMAEALLALLRDRALWEKMSDESLAIVRERFSLDALIAQLEEIYEEAFE